MPAVTHCTPGPYPPDLSRALLTGLQPLIHSRYATGLASRTRAIWQYQRVPALSGLLPTLTGAPRIRLPPASIRPLRQPNGRVSHPSRQSSASWRTQHRSTATATPTQLTGHLRSSQVAFFVARVTTGLWAVTGVLLVGVTAQSHHRWATWPVAAVSLAFVATNLASAIALWRRERSAAKAQLGLDDDA